MTKTKTSRVVENKRAYFEYEISDSFEAGLVLTGLEIKAFRAGQASLAGTFVRPLQSGAGGRAELWLINSHFAQATEPDRSRKLLLHRVEIDRLIGRIQEKGLTLIPIRLFLQRGRLKLLVGLGRGKKQYEKREVLKKRDLKRQLQQTLKR